MYGTRVAPGRRGCLGVLLANTHDHQQGQWHNSQDSGDPLSAKQAHLHCYLFAIHYKTTSPRCINHSGRLESHAITGCEIRHVKGKDKMGNCLTVPRDLMRASTCNSMTSLDVVKTCHKSISDGWIYLRPDICESATPTSFDKFVSI